MSNKEYDSIIDTLQIRVQIENLDDFTIVNREGFKYLKKGINTNINKQQMLIPMTLHKRENKDYKRLKTLTEHKEQFDLMLEDLRVDDKSKVELSRIDIAIDTKVDYYENFKFISYMLELVGYDERWHKSDRWKTTNMKTLKENSIRQADRKREIVFYDKNSQSKGLDFYNTRMEFRFKDTTSKDWGLHIDKVIKLISNMDKNIEGLSQDMILRLIELYEIEINNRNVKSLSEFVRKHNNCIFNADVMKGLYEGVNFEGSYDNWIREFRRDNKLEFISRSMINDYQADTKRSLKEYKNS